MFTSRVRDRNNVQLCHFCAVSIGCFSSNVLELFQINSIHFYHTTPHDKMYCSWVGMPQRANGVTLVCSMITSIPTRIVYHQLKSFLPLGTLSSICKEAPSFHQCQAQNFHLGQQRASTLVTWQSVKAALRKNIRTKVLYPLVFMHTLLIEWFHFVA